MTQPQQPFALHNPALLPADVLLAEFTARRPMLETLLGVVRSNKPGHPPQHCLLIGARGAGKTTTLWAVAHSLDRDVRLSRRWQPVVFDEESRRVGDLADFWLEAIRQWEHVTQDSSGRAQRLLEEAPADIEGRAQRTFMELVVQSGKRALLLIDNLNDLLGSIHDPEPLHRLRAFLMKESRVMIIGAATRTFDEISSIDEPFNDFFRCFELRPLSLEEMRDCLLNLAERRGDESVKLTLQKHDGTVRTLHLLTGGNPRLIKTFYRLLQEGLRGDIRRDLERLLDEFTPYFKAIVDALPGQQQRIFDAVALAWDPVEVAAVATVTRLPSNQVSAQLRALVKNGLLSEATGSPKRKTYLLTDRFSNIHYLMRHGRAARNRLDWFVALVRLVFPDSSDVLARVAREAAECGPEGQRDARAVLYSAFNRAGSVEARRNLLHATLRESWDSGTLESLAEWFDTERFKRDLPEIEIVAFFKQMPPNLRKKLGYKPADADWWLALTDFLEEKEAWPLAEAAYRSAASGHVVDIADLLILAPQMGASDLHLTVDSPPALRIHGHIAPVQGALSDRFGRRPIVLLSNFGLGCDYIFMALAPNLVHAKTHASLLVIVAAEAAVEAAVDARIADVERCEGYDAVVVDLVLDRHGRLPHLGPELRVADVQQRRGLVDRERLDRPGLGDDLVINIRDVHGLLHVVIIVFKYSTKQIVHHESAVIADMRRVIDGRAALVDRNRAFFEGLESLLRAREGIVNLDVHLSLYPLLLPEIPPHADCQEDHDDDHDRPAIRLLKNRLNR